MAYTKKLERRDLVRLGDVIDRWELAGQRQADAGDDEMAEMYFNDAEDLRALAALIKSGNYRRARNLAWRMDTEPRNFIPTRLYNVLFPEQQPHRPRRA